MFKLVSYSIYLLIRGQKESPGGALQAEIGSKYHLIAYHVLCQVETGLGVAKKINRLHLVTDFCPNRSLENRLRRRSQGARLRGGIGLQSSGK